MAKLRVYSPYFPYPFREASWQTVFNQAKAALDLGHEVEIVSWKTPPNKVREVLAKNIGLWPRDFQITVFSKSGPVRGKASHWLALTHLPPGLPQHGKLRRVLQAFGSGLAPVEVQYYDPQCDQRRFLEETDFEIYHYSFAYSWLRSPGRHAKKRVVHFHNLESELFKLRHQQSTNAVERLVHKRSATLLRRHETELTRMCDEIWQHTEQDLLELQKRISSKFTSRVVTPNIDEGLLKARRADKPESVLKLGFIGGLDFEPNFLSFKWILEKLCPILEKSDFKGEITQVGQQPERAAALAKPFDFVKLNGFVDNVEDWWKSLSFLLVPDVSGAGVRMKILEAIGSGVPVIANRQAVERLHPEVQKSQLLVVLEDEAAWAKFILSQQPQGFRFRLKDLPMNDGIRGSAIYGFLNQL